MTEDVKISRSSHETLQKLAERSGEPIQTILDKAIEHYRRQQFLAEASQAFAVLRQNEALWQEELQERQLWNQTLLDGVEES